MTAMDDLVQFLRDRLDEDEQIAHVGRPAELPLRFRQVGETGVILASDGTHAEECGKGNWADIAEHIARHDPAHVLARVGATRQILTSYMDAQLVCAEVAGWVDAAGATNTVTTPAPRLRRAVEPHARDAAFYLGPVIRLLALPYADHPDYRPEWRPST